MARFILDCEDEEIDKEALAAALSDEANSCLLYTSDAADE